MALEGWVKKVLKQDHLHNPGVGVSLIDSLD